MDMFDVIMDDMYHSDIQGSLDFYENAMKLLASQKHYQLALNVYDRLVAAGLTPSAVTWSCLVGFATEVGNFDLAVSFFEKLSSVTTPSIRAYMTILRVHGKRQDWKAASSIFYDMRARGAQIDGPVLNLVLAVGVAVDKIEAVEELLTEAEAMTPPVPDTVSYNTLVKGYAQRNDGQGALKTLCRMKGRKLSCTSITFNTALDAAFRGAMPRVALQILKSMSESGFRPDKYTGTILIKGLGKNATHDLIETCQGICRDPKCHMDSALRSKLLKCATEASAKIGSASTQRSSTPPWRRAS
jgi:pentatricopeptide repeat protein